VTCFSSALTMIVNCFSWGVASWFTRTSDCGAACAEAVSLAGERPYEDRKNARSTCQAKRFPKREQSTCERTGNRLDRTRARDREEDPSGFLGEIPGRRRTAPRLVPRGAEGALGLSGGREAEIPQREHRRDRVVFNIKGNRYRLVVRVNYELDVAYVRFVGTHEEYDEIDVREV